MIWGLAFLACMVLAIVIAVRAMRDQRRKGKGGFAAFVAGVFVGGFTGGFFIVVLGILALIFGDFSDEGLQMPLCRITL